MLSAWTNFPQNIHETEFDCLISTEVPDFFFFFCKMKIKSGNLGV